MEAKQNEVTLVSQLLVCSLMFPHEKKWWGILKINLSYLHLPIPKYSSQDRFYWKKIHWRYMTAPIFDDHATLFYHIHFRCVYLESDLMDTSRDVDISSLLQCISTLLFISSFSATEKGWIDSPRGENPP